MGWAANITTYLWPRVPDSVRDAYSLSQYQQLARQVPLLYTALIVIVIAAMAGAEDTTNPAIRLGVPLLVIAAFAGRLVMWLRRPKELPTPARARQMLFNAKCFSGTIAVICSAWCIESWATAATDKAMYFPLFMAMGSFATVTCLSMSRSGAFVNILAGQLPITVALVLSGNAMATAAGASIATTCIFLAALLRQQHERTVELLLLQHRMRKLAETDPLTGLINRRALQELLAAELARAADGQGPALMLLDLDGFKPVNDCHGHAAGDEVLVQVAARLRNAAGRDGAVCRLGGDEFAVLVPATARRTADAIGTALLAAMVPPFTFEGCKLSVGASLGLARWGSDHANPESLFAAADRALYAAKAQRDDESSGVPDQAVRKAWVIG